MSPLRITFAVAALTLAAAAPASAKSTVFGGSTKAGEPIAVTADRAAKKLRSAVVAIEAKCDDGGTWTFASRLSPSGDLDLSRNAKGRFAGRADSIGDVGGTPVLETLKLTGRMTARRASGTLVLAADWADGSHHCRSGTVRWSATRSPGRVYAGATKQGEPVVVRVNQARTNVDDVLIGWETSTCTPDFWTRYGDDLGSFPLRASSFGDAFTASGDDGSGGKVTVDYTVDGTVSAAKSNGTLHVGLTRTDASGATVLTCDSGQIGWTATTG